MAGIVATPGALSGETLRPRSGLGGTHDRRLALPIALAAALGVVWGCADRVERAYRDCLAKIEVGGTESRSRDRRTDGGAIAGTVSDNTRSAGTAA